MADNNINLFDFHNLLNKNIQLSYKGPFDRHILYPLGNYIKKNLTAGNRIFGIFIELAQNITYYSAETTDSVEDGKTYGVGTLVIGEYDDYYTFATGNAVKNDCIIPIIEKCEIINSLDREELRDYKRKQRRLPRGQKGGAHIGLIQVALTSMYPLDFQVTPIDESTSFFSIFVKIDK